MEGNEFKCPNCGANISKEEKKCSYCGSPNKFFLTSKPQQEEKNNKKESNKDAEEDLDIFEGTFGGFLGGVALSKVFKDITKTFLPHKKGK